MKWLNLSLVSDRQLTTIVTILDDYQFIEHIHNLTNNSIQLLCDNKIITIAPFGELTQEITEVSVQLYLANLFKARLLYNLDDDVTDLVWSVTPPNSATLAQMKNAQDSILAWCEQNKVDVFLLYPAELL